MGFVRNALNTCAVTVHVSFEQRIVEYSIPCALCELCVCCLISPMLKCIHTVQSVRGTFDAIDEGFVCMCTRSLYVCCMYTILMLSAFSIPFSPIYLLPFLQNNITSFIFTFRRIQSIIHVNIILCLRRSHTERHRPIQWSTRECRDTPGEMFV